MKKAIAAMALVTIVLAGCGDDGSSTPADSADSGLPQGAEAANLDPADFTTEIDNQFFPLPPGARWVYREFDAESSQRVVVTVTPKTKLVANGVEARVVQDVVSEDGEIVENTYDYYAQDGDGNVWYLGEATTEYENGKPVSRKGSFEAGVDGAEAGVIMPADPEPGLSYRQEYYEGEAEDRGAIVSTDEQVESPLGRFQGAIETRDTNPLEPKVNEHKFFAPGVGMVLAIDISGGASREELIGYSEGR
jgi:hypothetical protein